MSGMIMSMGETRQQRRARERAEAKAAQSSVVVGLGEQDLVNGWSAGPDTTIRLATPEDVDRVAELVQLADVSLEVELVDALREDEVVAAALRAGLRSGQDALLRDVASAATRATDEPAWLYMRSALPLVAEQRDVGVIGTLLAYPPINVIGSYSAQAAIWGRQEQQKIAMGGAIALSRIKAVAVAEAARGTGVGAALLWRCVQVYRVCGFRLVYGQVSAERGLAAFYSRLGFDVGTVNGELDLWEIFGVPSAVHAGHSERLFARWL